MPLYVLHFWCQMYCSDGQSALQGRSYSATRSAVGLRQNARNVKGLLLCVVDGHSKCKVESALIQQTVVVIRIHHEWLNEVNNTHAHTTHARTHTHTHTHRHTTHARTLTHTQRHRSATPHGENIPRFCGKYVVHTANGQETTKFMSLAVNTWTVNHCGDDTSLRAEGAVTGGGPSSALLRELRELTSTNRKGTK